MKFEHIILLIYLICAITLLMCVIFLFYTMLIKGGM